MKIKKTLNLLTASILGMTFNAYAYQINAPTFIEPPMVNIPSGDFFMGSDRGEEDEKPVRKVSIAAFQMGKYEVTVAEFKKFIAATNYEMPKNCYQHVLGGERKDLAGWDDNVYNISDYHPVVCLPQAAAVAYADWLSAQTGKQYRLPSEAEWEYTVRAGTNSRHFFGEQSDSSLSCGYANISDWYAATMSGKLIPGANVRDIEQCNDNEATLATVGLYKPNPFGVYDLVGNVMEYLGDCYVDNYASAPADGSTVTKEGCTEYSVRGGSWHWYPWYSSQRGRMSNDFLGALEGFRLVLDTQGAALPDQKGTKSFVKNLTQAQKRIKSKHASIPEFPRKPVGLKAEQMKNKTIKVSWLPNSENFVSGYRVYRKNPVTNETQVISNNVKSPYFIDRSPLAHNARYSVAALNGKTESEKSISIDNSVITTHTIPTKIQGEAFNLAEGIQVRDSVLEAKHDKIFSAIGSKTASYQISVPKSGSYVVDARVFHPGDESSFELWVGDKKLLTKNVEGDNGWQTIENIDIDLPSGINTLRVKGNNPRFSLNWLNFKN